jgi:hypothetical protein
MLFKIHPPMSYHPRADVQVDGSGLASASVKARWDGCLQQIVGPLGFGGKEKAERNRWCNYTHLGQCSFAGVYQPDLPDAATPYGRFVLIGTVYGAYAPSFLALTDF